MHRKYISEALRAYRETVLPQYAAKLLLDLEDLERENNALARMEELAKEHPDCFVNTHYHPGHFTGSALVVNPTCSRLVLTLHAKLHLWLQVGGHADGHGLLHEVSLREAEEETGLKQLRIVSPFGMTTAGDPLPFDLDIHVFPAKQDKPAHLHFDVRYLIVAEDSQLTKSPESLDLRWFTFEELAEPRRIDTDLPDLMLKKAQLVLKRGSRG